MDEGSGTVFERSNEAVSESAYFGDQCVQATAIVSDDELSSRCQDGLRVQFPVRAERNLQMMKVTRSTTTVTLSDVRRNGNSGFAHLMRQAEPLACGKMFCQVVDQIDEVHGFLPRD